MRANHPLIINIIRKTVFNIAFLLINHTHTYIPVSADWFHVDVAVVAHCLPRARAIEIPHW